MTPELIAIRGVIALQPAELEAEIHETAARIRGAVGIAQGQTEFDQSNIAGLLSLALVGAELQAASA